MQENLPGTKSFPPLWPSQMSLQPTENHIIDCEWGQIHTPARALPRSSSSALLSIISMEMIVRIHPLAWSNGFQAPNPSGQKCGTVSERVWVGRGMLYCAMAKAAQLVHQGGGGGGGKSEPNSSCWGQLEPSFRYSTNRTLILSFSTLGPVHRCAVKQRKSPCDTSAKHAAHWFSSW